MYLHLLAVGLVARFFENSGFVSGNGVAGKFVFALSVGLGLPRAALQPHGNACQGLLRAGIRDDAFENHLSCNGLAQGNGQFGAHAFWGHFQWHHKPLISIGARDGDAVVARYIHHQGRRLAG